MKQLLYILTESKPAKVFHVAFFCLCLMMIFLLMLLRTEIECKQAEGIYTHGVCL